MEIRNFECKKCQKKFKTKYDVKLHQTTHSEDRPFKCTTCDKMFKTKLQSTRHMKLHLKEKTLGCDKCNQKFQTQSNLTWHVQSTHWTASDRKRRKLKGWCTSCGLTTLTRPINRNEGLCSICLSHKLGIPVKHNRKLQGIFFTAVEKDFNKRYPNLPYLPISQDKYFIGGKSCNTGKRQPDQAWRVGPLSNGRYRLIDGEFDEDYHVNYESSCEVTKMTDTK